MLRVIAVVGWEYRLVLVRTQIRSDHFHADRKPVIEGVEDELNKLGKDGWELVNAQNIRLPDDRMFTLLYFKRKAG